jgi:cobalt/nickel transport system permease protein
MHIADGALSTPVMIATNVLAAAGVTGCLRVIDYDRVPRIGVLAAVFFMASFIHVKIGPSSVHLLLNGLLGLLLGWAALPALAVALFLQTVLLGFGGMSALGANVLGMGIPAIVVGLLFSGPCRGSATARRAMALGAAAGVVSVVLTCATMALLLLISNPRAYATAVTALLLAHVPVLLVESVVIGAAVAFLHRVRPELLDAPLRGPNRREPS